MLNHSHMSGSTRQGANQGNLMMSDTTITPNTDTTPEPTAHEPAKSHFTKAMEEAKAGAQALGKEAQERAGEYREKLNQTRSEWTSEARAKSGEARDKAHDYAHDAKEKAYGYANEAKDKAYGYAQDGKARTSEAISGLAKLVQENASKVDETVGEKYGDYARSAAQSMQDAATRLDEKSFEELGEDAKEFIREKPALAVGLAAAAGYMVARVFRRR